MARASLGNRLSRVETSQPPPPAPTTSLSFSRGFPASRLRTLLLAYPHFCLTLPKFSPRGCSPSPSPSLSFSSSRSACSRLLRSRFHLYPTHPLPKPLRAATEEREGPDAGGELEGVCVCARVAAAVAAAASGPRCARTGLWEQSKSPLRQQHTHLSRPKGNQSN